MAAFHPAVVSFASFGIASELSIQRVEELLGQLTNAVGIVAAELLAPVGLERDSGLNAESPEPHKSEHHETQAVGAIEPMAISEESQPGAALTGGPLIAWEPLVKHVSGSFRA